MARPNPIRKIMATPLPTRTLQRTKPFRPTEEDIIYAYNIINQHVFDGQLRRPKITQGRIKKCWGLCRWHDDSRTGKFHTDIKLVDKWYCVQWFMNTLAHEMIHQWQWEVYRVENGGIYELSGAHGPSFFLWRDRFAEYGLHLKTSHRMKKWFRYQDFNKC
jgi:hypothetical protein